MPADPVQRFAPVWTTLFVLMALALWRVWRLPASPVDSGARRNGLSEADLDVPAKLSE